MAEVAQNKVKQYYLKKMEIWAEIRDLTKKQRLWIEQEELKRLTNTIDAKERRINKIKDIDQILKKHYAHITGDKETAEYQQKIQEIIEEINEAEKSNMTLLQEASNTYKKKLIETQTKIKVNTIYNPKNDMRNGRFIDKRK